MSKGRAIVIGSGFGGLASAIRLQAAGVDTILIEKRDAPGGRAYVYRDKGFVFDAGPTVITAPHCIEELFELSGKKMDDYLRLLPVNPFYRLCWEDGEVFDYSNDEKMLFDQIRAKSEADLEGYKRFFQYSEKVFEAGYRKLVHVPFLKLWDMLRVAPQLVRLKAYRSVYATVSKFIKDERLRQAFSFHSLLIGGNPFASSSIYTLIHALERKWGVFFAKGGTNALVSALAKLFEDLGGEVRLSTSVDEIITEKGRVIGVRTDSKEVIGADLVVSNADVNHTYAKLLRNESRVRSTRFRLNHMRYSQALFVLYFGTDKVYEDLAHHSILFCNRYKPLLDEIFYKGTLPTDNSLYLHAPCRTDPSLAPPGCDAFYVLANVPNLKKAPLDWDVEGPRYSKQIIEYLERFYMPDLSKHIVTQRAFTPKDFATELNAHQGTAFSLEPTLLQSAYFRVPNRDKKLSGLYFVGAGTHPGAGVPGVVNSAKATTGVILSDLLSQTAQLKHEVVYGQ